MRWWLALAMMFSERATITVPLLVVGWYLIFRGIHWLLIPSK